MRAATWAALVLIGSLVGAACANNYPAPTLSPSSSAGQDPLPSAAAGQGAAPPAEASGALPAELPAEELERELHLSRAGQVLLRALRAHGGWDAWRRLRRVRLQMERVYSSADPQKPAGGQGREVASLDFQLDPRTLRLQSAEGKWRDATGPRFQGAEAHDFHLAFWPAREGGAPALEPLVDGGAAGESSPGTAKAGEFVPAARVDEFLLMPFFELAAPFGFVGGDLKAEYLGIERDAANGVELAKVRYFRPEPEDALWCVAYFDTTSHFLRRILLPERSGGFRCLFYSRAVEWGGSGLRLATRRTAYRLGRLYGHLDRRAIEYVETLSEMQLDLEPEDGG
jgi:hypothetical protein